MCMCISKSYDFVYGIMICLSQNDLAYQYKPFSPFVFLFYSTAPPITHIANLWNNQTQLLLGVNSLAASLETRRTCVQVSCKDV